MRRYQQQITR